MSISPVLVRRDSRSKFMLETQPFDQGEIR